MTPRREEQPREQDASPESIWLNSAGREGRPEGVTCSKCNDTGYLSRRFYTVARHCDCPRGIERAGWDSLSAEEQNERAAAEAAAMRATRKARREAR